MTETLSALQQFDARRYVEENTLARVQQQARRQYLALYAQFANTGEKFHVDVAQSHSVDPITFQEANGVVAVVLGNTLSVLDGFTRKAGIMVQPVYGRKWFGLREDRENCKAISISGYLGDQVLEDVYICAKRTMYSSLDKLTAALSKRASEESRATLAAVLDAPQQIVQAHSSGSIIR